MRLSPCVLVQPDGWARGEREGYGEPCDVTSLSLSLCPPRRNSVDHRTYSHTHYRLSRNSRMRRFAASMTKNDVAFTGTARSTTGP